MGVKIKSRYLGYYALIQKLIKTSLDEGDNMAILAALNRITHSFSILSISVFCTGTLEVPS